MQDYVLLRAEECSCGCGGRRHPKRAWRRIRGRQLMVPPMTLRRSEGFETLAYERGEVVVQEKAIMVYRVGDVLTGDGLPRARGWMSDEVVRHNWKEAAHGPGEQKDRSA